MYCDYSSSKMRELQNTASDASRKSKQVLEEVRDMKRDLAALSGLKGDLEQMFNKVMERMDTLEQAIVDPKSDAARKIALKQIKKIGRE